MLVVKIIVQEDVHTFPCSNKVIPGIFTSSIFFVHSSTNLSINLFLHLQHSWSKYSPTSHDLSHSHSQLLLFQINHSLHIPLSINFLHSYLHLSLFHLCLLLQTLASSLNLHLHVLCYSACFVSLGIAIRLNTLAFKFFTTSFWSIDIIKTTAAFTCLNTK